MSIIGEFTHIVWASVPADELKLIVMVESETMEPVAVCCPQSPEEVTV